MLRSDENRIRYGTAENLPSVHNVSLGPLSFSLERGSLRSLSWRGVEVVRGVSLVLRDENWGILSAQNIREELKETSSSFEMTQRLSYLDGNMLGVMRISASADGHVECTCELTATADVMVNRAGFTILHPVMGVSGCPLSVRHANGMQAELHFPRLIASAQPVFDIAGLSHQIENRQVSFEFEGEVFEMEDQRNWSDASFKTYCRPLDLPFPYCLNKGSVTRQSVQLRLADIGEGGVDVAGHSDQDVSKPKRAPDILLAADSDWTCFGDEPTTGFVLRLGQGHECSRDYLHSLAMLARSSHAYIDAELIIEGDSGATAQIRNMASILGKAKISPRHVIALPEAYLKSYQPAGPWPAGLTPNDCVAATRRFFPNAEIGLGSLTNFTELNRCQPEPGKGDYITHGNAAIVHAADDHSVIETLEALPQIFDSGWAIAGDRGYRLGLVAIGMRSNPYGATLAKNPQNVRKTMTADDPRQMGLFAAAYAIGVAAKAAESGIEAVTLAGVGGPFSTRNQETLFPIFHVVKALSALAGRKVQPIKGAAVGVVGLRFDGGIIVANCSPDPIEITDLPPVISVLDVMQFEAASRDPDWLANARQPADGAVILGAFACLFTDAEANP